MNAAHFLDEVLLDRDVEAMARRNHAEDVASACDLHAEPAQDVLDLRARNLDPEEARDALRAQRDARALWQLRLDLRHDRGPRTSAGNLHEQLGRTLDGAFLAARIHATLEALGGVRHEAEAARDARDGIRREKGGFEEYVGGVRGNAALLAAHDAGKAHRPGFVRDDEHGRIQRDLAAVQEQRVSRRRPHSSR